MKKDWDFIDYLQGQAIATICIMFEVEQLQNQVSMLQSNTILPRSKIARDRQIKREICYNKDITP